MDRLDELTIFQTIVETKSLVGAARKLGMSKPKISRSLAALEARVGCRLFERNTRRIALTAAGEELAERATTILAEYQIAIDGSNSALIRGPLRITAPVQFGRRHLARRVMQFLDLYPLVSVELVLNDRNLDMIEERLDVAIRIGSLADSALVARKVAEVRRIVVASPEYLSKRGVPQSPAELDCHEKILGPRYDSRHEWQFGGVSLDEAIEVNSRLSIDDVDGVLLAARMGCGIARVLSYQAAADLKSGLLVRILDQYEPSPLPVHVLTPSRRHMASRQRVFVDYIVDALRGDRHLTIQPGESTA